MGFKTKVAMCDVVAVCCCAIGSLLCDWFVAKSHLVLPLETETLLVQVSVSPIPR